MFFLATKRAFALLHAMLTRCASHKTFFVLSRFHCYNIPHKWEKVKRQCGTPTSWHETCPRPSDSVKRFYRWLVTLKSIAPHINIKILIINIKSIIFYPLRGCSSTLFLFLYRLRSRSKSQCRQHLTPLHARSALARPHRSALCWMTRGASLGSCSGRLSTRVRKLVCCFLSYSYLSILSS